jgi:hypothetical protein
MQTDAEKVDLERMKKQLSLIFMVGKPAPLFVSAISADKQAIIEILFSEEAVENPEERKTKLKGYCR